MLKDVPFFTMLKDVESEIFGMICCQTPAARKSACLSIQVPCAKRVARVCIHCCSQSKGVKFGFLQTQVSMR